MSLFKKIGFLILFFSVLIPFQLKSESRGVSFCESEAEFFKSPKGDSSSKTVLILPGGGYQHHAMDHEGYDWVPFFNDLGINVVVLKYKLPSGDPSVPFNDVKHTMKTLKDKSVELGLDPDKIGIMGFSAGGHLASTYATHAEKEDRPAFQILFYPVISLQPGLVHEGSRDNLLGENQGEDNLLLYSNEFQVTQDTPPAILFHSDDDGFVPRENSVDYYLALNKAGVPSSLHIYPVGGHGWGFRDSLPYHDVMLEELSVWLSNLNL